MAPREHEWSEFEMHTLLCLMARGIHLPPVKMKRDEDEGAARQHAHVNVATDLNAALNGESNFVNDISKRDVSRMIDRILSEKKGIMGPGGYMERSKFPRITRGLRRVFERQSKLDFDGSESEWNLWRREEEAEKRRIKMGDLSRLEARECLAVVDSIGCDDEEGDLRCTGRKLNQDERAEQRDAAERMRQDYLSGGYDRTPRRVKQLSTTDPDANIWAQADIAASTIRSQTQGCTTPPYVLPHDIYACTDPKEAEDHTSQSTISTERLLQHHTRLPAKPQVASFATPNLNYAPSSPGRRPIGVKHALPKKPVSILKNSKNKSRANLDGKKIDLARFQHVADIEGELEKREEIYGRAETEKTGASLETLLFDRLERGSADSEMDEVDREANLKRRVLP